MESQKINEYMDRAYAEGVGPELVAADVLSDAGTDIWVVLNDCQGGPVRVETFDSSETPVWKDGVVAVYFGRATGWGNQDSSFWFDGLCHRDEETGLYVLDDDGTVIGDGSEKDAARLALEEGHYPELCDQTIERLREAAKELEDWPLPLAARRKGARGPRSPEGQEEREMTQFTFILGAGDPEMAAVETLARAAGARVGYAMRGHERVRPGDAYRAEWVRWDEDDSAGPVEGTVVLVECDFSEGVCPPWEDTDRMVEVVRVDHHRPGDPGYGLPPEKFLRASSIGQVLDLLGIEPTSEHRMIAAADHCLGAAYAGRCPDIDPDTLLAHRVASRAAFLGFSEGKILRDIEETTAALETAPWVILGIGKDPDEMVDRSGEDPRWSGGSFHHPRWWHICVRDMRREPPYHELIEAATRIGVGYIAGPFGRPGERRKYTCSGSAEELRAFIAEWAPAHGLTDIYGDPVRGFAGGYLPAMHED